MTSVTPPLGPVHIDFEDWVACVREAADAAHEALARRCANPGDAECYHDACWLAEGHEGFHSYHYSMLGLG